MAKKSSTSTSPLNKVLPKETAALYRIIGLKDNTTTRMVHVKYGEIDFKRLSVKKAEALVKRGADFIEAVPKTDPAEKSKD